MSYLDKRRKEAAEFAKGLYKSVAELCGFGPRAKSRRATLAQRRLTASVFERAELAAKSPVTAVAIGRGTIEQHSGILFYDEDSGQIKFTHQAWHHHLQCGEQDPERYGFVRADTTIPENDIIAATCNNLEKKFHGGGIAYALDYSAQISRSGDVTYLTQFGGLSCATFIMAVFAAAGINLIDAHGWPTGRPDDEEIQKKTVAFLSKHPSVSPEHVRAQKALIGRAKRFRPTEVAAAAYLAGASPSRFKDLKTLAEQIQQDLMKLLKPPE